MALSSPYKISTKENLWYVSDNYTELNSKHFVLTSNINLECSEEAQWIPIGFDKDMCIAGITFDGAGHTISGIYINNQGSSNSGYQGLFGSISSSRIYNLTIEGTIASNNQNSGGIAGMAQCTTIINCHNRANITGTSRVGGIAGGAGESIIYNCSNTGTIIGDDYNTDKQNTSRILMRIGGIAGTSGDTEICNCYNAGDVRNINSGSEAVAFAIASPGGDDTMTESVNICYYRQDCGGVDTLETSIPCTDDYMKSGDLVVELNNGVSYNNVMLEWVLVDGGYPTTVAPATVD